MLWLFVFFVGLFIIGSCLRTNTRPPKDYAKIRRQEMNGHQAVDTLMTLFSIPIIILCVLGFIGELIL